MSANWTTTEEAKRLEEQIDPSFSRNNSEAAGISDEAFEAAAAAVVAATTDASEEQLAAQQQLQREQEEQAQQQLDAAAAAAAVENEVVNNNELEPQNKPILNNEGQQISRNGRVLSGTKRAEQNRQAQRAFRQRKDIYVRDLEKKASEVETLKATIEALKNENMQLRDYSLALQAKLIETDVPAPPGPFSGRSNIDKD